MDDNDLHGQPAPAPKKRAGSHTPPKMRKPRTNWEREAEFERRRQEFLKPKRTKRNAKAEKEANRLAAFYERMTPPGHPKELRWRHHHWQPKRTLVRQALEAAGGSAEQMNNFDNCGSMAYAQWSEIAQRFRISASYCKCRHCEPCARSKAGKLAANLKKRLKEAKRHEYRLFTLTLRHSNAPLIDQIKRLYACFKKLRQTKAWKASQQGGVMILEVKWSATGWHPHIHNVVQGDFMKNTELSALWKEITGDSHIVDVRAITRGEDAAHYVTKYLTKSTNDGVWQNPQAAAEWVIASKSLRTCNTFGSWRKWPLLKVTDAPTDWVTSKSLVQWILDAEAGSRVAIEFLNTIRPHRYNETQLLDEVGRDDPDATDSG